MSFEKETNGYPTDAEQFEHMAEENENDTADCAVADDSVDCATADGSPNDTAEEFICDRRQKAMTAFVSGYNCAQSVVYAFADLPEIREKIAPQILLSLASSFGGGVGRLREVCGTVSGMAIILGILYGYSGPETGQPKADHYARIQELAHRFEEEKGSIICRELLGLTIKHDVPTPEARTKEYYQKRPCGELAGCMAGIVAEYLMNQKNAQDK